MSSRPTAQQYRRLAEGLLREALNARVEKKQDSRGFIFSFRLEHRSNHKRQLPTERRMIR